MVDVARNRCVVDGKGLECHLHPVIRHSLPNEIHLVRPTTQACDSSRKRVQYINKQKEAIVQYCMRYILFAQSGCDITFVSDQPSLHAVVHKCIHPRSIAGAASSLDTPNDYALD